MPRLSVLTIATEAELETEKLMRVEDAVNKSGNSFSDLYSKVWIQENEKKMQKDQPVESTGGSSYSSDSSSDDSSSDDSSEDSDSDDDGMDFDMEDEPSMDEEQEDEDTEEEEDSTEAEATESAYVFTVPSLESLEAEFALIHSNVASEALDGNAGVAIWEAAKTVGSAMYVAGTSLGWVGVNILWPGMKHLYKVVIYLGAKFVRYGYLSSKKVKDTHDKFKVRTSKLREDIDAASIIVKTLAQRKAAGPKEKDETITSVFENVKVINRMKIGSDVNPNSTSVKLHDFIKGWYSKTSEDIAKDTASIKHVLHYGTGASINPVKTFGDSSMRKGLVPDTRATHDAQNDFVDPLRYPQVFPGDMIYCAVLPNGKAKTIEDVRLAYQASACSFNLDPSSFKNVEQVDYMKLEDVITLLASLGSMLDTLEKQEEVYTQINKEKSAYLAKFKKYFLSLADYDKKISVEQSMLEYIYLRGVFIDNVYTVTARDIHKFTQMYIANVLTYVKSNLDKLSS